jgi:DUF917 family protein
MWQITLDDITSIAIGAGILGTGGGGNPYLGEIWMKRLLAQGYSATVIDLAELADDALVSEVGGMGAPTVGIEKLPRGDEPRWAIEALEAYTGKYIDAILCAEIGGSNSIAPLVAGALTGKPVLDADAMGRAFPELQMSTHFIAGVSCTPAALVDEKGNRIVFGHITDPFALERFARDLCIAMGCRAELAMPVMSGKQAKQTSVRRTMTLAKQVGDAVRRARQNKESMIDTVLAVTGGSELFAGKLVDVQRRTTGGFARGELVMEGLGRYRREWLHIAFQNENLVAWRGDRQTRGTAVACVPDLICILETETGEPITTEQLRYGLRVTVLGIPCSDKLRTPQALQVVGPAAFGYPEVTYVPMPKVMGQGLE